MKRASSGFVGSAAAAMAGWASLPGLARACPMCFAGGEQNQDAFLYGSIFLMVVPVTAIGGLVFWAYKRIKASEHGGFVSDENVGDPTREATTQGPTTPANGVVLQMAPRR
jgi:hypothetical protein